MLKKIQLSFSDQELYNYLSLPWLIVLLAICLGLVMVLILLRQAKKKKQALFPYGSLADEKQIREILHLAFDQRQPLELQIQGDEATRRPTFRCSPSYIGLTNLTVEINGIKQLSDQWLNRDVRAFFRIRVDKKSTYFTFDSQIESIVAPDKDVCQLVLSFPTLLDNKQKRSFLRLTPPANLVRGSALWHAISLPEPEKMSDLALWPLPTLLFMPQEHEQYRLVNISAGGMHLCIPRSSMRKYNLEFSSVEQLIVMLDILDPEAKKTMRCWLQCRVRSLWEDELTKDLHMGLQFIAWARPKGPDASGAPSTQLEWLRLSNANEVEVIGNWIMRRHLEMHRETPQKGN